VGQPDKGWQMPGKRIGQVGQGQADPFGFINRRVEPVLTLQPAQEFWIGHYHFNYKLRCLKRGQQEQKLSPKEAELLRLLCQQINDVLPRAITLKQLWGEDNYFTTRSMDVFIAKLRKYLKDDPRVEITNIHGNGFRLQVNG
jgi:two-component system, OmpR family, response regulator